MIRQIIHIDQEKCNGCGLCIKACHEGAIALIGGKAYLAREHYCDGLGDCLPGCPTGAITFETREAQGRKGCGSGRLPWQPDADAVPGAGNAPGRPLPQPAAAVACAAQAGARPGPLV